MTNASNALTADRAGSKTGSEKAGEKVVEKRRALGRGLDSLLPGPRVVAPTRVEGPANPARLGVGIESHRAEAALAPASSTSASTAEITASPVPGFVGELQASEKSADGEMVYTIALEAIDRNPYQTRKVFDEDSIAELADSIRRRGFCSRLWCVRGRRVDGTR